MAGKRKAVNDPQALEGTVKDVSSATEAVKRHRSCVLKEGNDVKKKPAPFKVKKRRGRPLSEKTLRKRKQEAEEAARAAAAVEAGRSSPVVHAGPSMEHQIKRLQEDDSDNGSGFRRRSSSIEALYAKVEPTLREVSRLENCSGPTSGPVDVSVPPPSGDKSAAEQLPSSQLSAGAVSIDSKGPTQQPPSARSATSGGVDVSVPPPSGDKFTAEQQPSSEPSPAAASADSKYPTQQPSSGISPTSGGVKVSVPPSMEDKSTAEQQTSSKPSAAAVWADSKEAPSKKSTGGKQPSSKPSPAEASADSKHAPSNPSSRRVSPVATPKYIPLGKAAAAKTLKKMTASQALGASARPTKRPIAAQSKLDLDSVARSGARRSVIAVAAKQASQQVASQASAQLADSALKSTPSSSPPEATPAEMQAASSAPAQPEQPAQPSKQAGAEAEQLAPAADMAAVQAPPQAEKKPGVMDYQLEKAKAPSPKVTAITAPRMMPGVEDGPSRLASSAHGPPLASAQPPAEDSANAPDQQKQAEEDRKRADAQRRVLREIEAGLDRASVAVPAIKAITTLVLKPAAQGLEPRIVRLIIEKVEQDTNTEPLAGRKKEEKGEQEEDKKTEKKIALLYVLDSVFKQGKATEAKHPSAAITKSMQRYRNAVTVGLPTLIRATQGDPKCHQKTLKVFGVWHERDVLPKKVLQPQLEYLRSNPVLMEQPRDVLPKKDPASQLEHFKSNPVIAEQPRTIEEEFGMQLAEDDIDSEEGGWEEDGAEELPSLPQVEEALKKALEQQSGGTEKPVGTTPDSPNASPWHQGPSPKFTLPGDSYPGLSGPNPGSETPPDIKDRAAKAPWHQPAAAPAPMPPQNGMQAPWQQPVCGPPQALYPHQMAATYHPPHLPQPSPPIRPLPSSWQPGSTFDSPNTDSPGLSAGPGSAHQTYRQGSVLAPASAAPPYLPPITLMPPNLAQQGHMAPVHSYGPPAARQPVSMPQAPAYHGYGYDQGVHENGVAPLDLFEDPYFVPPLPDDDPPPLPDEEPPPLPDEAPPPLPSDYPPDVNMEDAPPPFHHESVLYQQTVYTCGHGY